MSNQHAWEPHGYYATRSNIARFSDRYGYDSYEELRPDTEGEITDFWSAVDDDTAIVWDKTYDTILDTSEGIQFADWFAGGRLNLTRTVIDRWVETAPDRLAYVWEGEAGERVAVTFLELDAKVNRLANALRARGIGRGDVVGIVAPLTPRAIAASLACFKVGAVHTEIFAGYGARAIRERLADCEAELVFVADGYRRNGEIYDLRAKLDDALDGVPTVETVVTDAHVDIGGSISGGTEIAWDTFIEGRDTSAEATVVDADRPALIAYSSGTTGKPKGTVHTQATLLASGLKEAKYQFDVCAGDTFLWVTDYGWIVVPAWIMAGATGLGATTVLVGGAPAYPSEERLWDVVDRRRVTTLGMSPTSARSLKQANEAPRQDWDLTSLRILGSTGEPWDRETWEWHLEAVGGGHLPIINDSGGTEICGGILSPTPLTPLKPGTLYGPAPGIPAAVYDASGTPADEGYLVVEGPVPGMTRSLTGGDQRYLEEYWNDFGDAWNQDDWVRIDEDGFWYIEGRADDTMNVSGRRVTAPTIEGGILEHEPVDEAAVISITDERGNTRPVAFVTVAQEVDENEFLTAVNERITDSLGAPFTLADLHKVEAIPRTQTGKIPRGRIEAVYVDGDIPDDAATLENGEVLSEFPRQL